MRRSGTESWWPTFDEWCRAKWYIPSHSNSASCPHSPHFTHIEDPNYFSRACQTREVPRCRLRDGRCGHRRYRVRPCACVLGQLLRLRTTRHDSTSPRTRCRLPYGVFGDTPIRHGQRYAFSPSIPFRPSSPFWNTARPFDEVQRQVADLLKDRILVGHAVHNDLKALLLSHPRPHARDTQLLAHKHKVSRGRRPALRHLVQQELGLTIQSGEHSSVRTLFFQPRARFLSHLLLRLLFRVSDQFAHDV